MQLHGGHIGVFSEGENTGSTFYIDIPVARVQRAAIEPNEAQDSMYLKMLNASDDSRDTHSTAAILLPFQLGGKANRSSSKTTSTTMSSQASIGLSASSAISGRVPPH